MSSSNPARQSDAAERESRRGPKADAKADLIRKAAYQCFARHGYFGTTIDLICTEAKISKGAFYWHFESKQALFLNILSRWADEVEGELLAQFRAALSGSGPNALFAVRAAIEREARRGRAIMPVWLEFLSQVGRNDEMRAAIADFHQRIRGALATLLRPSLPSFDDAQVQAFASIVLASFVGLVAQDIADPAGASFDTNAKRGIEMLAAVSTPKK